jgi:alkylation response protein AidB-like acyl-CoA dehydrogenase
MTEKRGGSDVNTATETFALEKDRSRCFLYGYKWFTSATDSEMTLTLARFPQTEDELEKNTGKLAMVMLKTRKPDGRELNNIEVVRLKDKLGTR